jgi:hypothetical protein
VALLYHEARNVRHLVRAGFINKDRWRYLVSLPVNRDDAWREIEPFRAAARTAASADDVVSVFEERFRINVEDVVTMLGDANWRHAGSYGGNAWKSIGVSVMELRAALRAGNADAAKELVVKIRSAHRYRLGQAVPA